jgi:hypothetical protein
MWITLSFLERPFSKIFFIGNFSIAHGTMVNGEALTPASPYTVLQGDTVQMGASTRSYKVDWVTITAIEQVSEASVSVLERSSPDGSKASFRYELGNVQVIGCFTLFIIIIAGSGYSCNEVIVQFCIHCAE